MRFLPPLARGPVGAAAALLTVSFSTSFGTTGIAATRPAAVRPAARGPVAAQEPGSPLGSWRPREYRLADGEVLPVDGRIHFFGDEAGGEWIVVFFVLEEGDGAAPLRGSAEGGRFFRDGDTLTLTHTLHLSAGEAVGPLPESPLRMAMRSEREAAENHREPCRFSVEGDRLTLFFPSGNSMVFRRV